MYDSNLDEYFEPYYEPREGDTKQTKKEVGILKTACGGQNEIRHNYR